jgi:hypothetical protein
LPPAQNQRDAESRGQRGEKYRDQRIELGVEALRDEQRKRQAGQKPDAERDLERRRSIGFALNDYAARLRSPLS